MFVDHEDVRGIYTLLFDFVKRVIHCSEKNNMLMELHLDERNTFYIKCNFAPALGESDSFWLKFQLDIIETLSCEFDLKIEQGSIDLRFKPDREIFTYDTIAYHRLFMHLKELAQLNENVKFLLSDNENKNIIQFQNGLEVMLMDGVYDFGLPRESKPLNINFTKDDIDVSISMIYAFATDIALSYVNNARTQDGGTHVQGLFDGILTAFQDYIQNTEIRTEIVKDHPVFFLNEQITGSTHVFDKNPNILKDDVVEKLNFVIQVKLEEPSWGGNTKRQIVNEEVYSVVKHGVMECLKEILDSDPSFFYYSRVIPKAELRKLLSGCGE